MKDPYKQNRKAIYIDPKDRKTIEKGMEKEKEKSFSKYVVEAGVNRAKKL